MKVSEAAVKWGLSARRVRILCEEGRIYGITRKGKLYMIPIDAVKPQDGSTTAKGRVKLNRLLEEIDKNFEKLSTSN